MTSGGKIRSVSDAMNRVRKHAVFDAEQPTVLSSGLPLVRTNKANLHGRTITVSLNLHGHQ